MQSITTSETPEETTRNTVPVHTLSVFVNNKAGVLMRICQVFARRGYNIDSLVVSRGRDKHFSRMTIGVSGDSSGLEQIILQVTKLVDVIHCVEHTRSDSVNKELRQQGTATRQVPRQQAGTNGSPANYRPLRRQNRRSHPHLHDRHD